MHDHSVSIVLSLCPSYHNVYLKMAGVALIPVFPCLTLQCFTTSQVPLRRPERAELAQRYRARV